MADTRDHPISEWSDNQLLDEYRSREGADGSVRPPDRAEVTEELLRRGLKLPDEPADPQPEDVDWSGPAGGEDPGSGALPKPF